MFDNGTTPGRLYVAPTGAKAVLARRLLEIKSILHPRLHFWLMNISQPLWRESKLGIRVKYGYVSMFVDLREGAEQEIFLDRYDPALTAFVFRICRKGDVVIDIGANVGIVSIIAANCVSGEGRVLAVEPNPKLARRLRQVKDMNRLAQLDVEMSAVGPDQGKAILHLSSSHPYSTLDEAYLPDYPVVGKVEVDVITLESLITDHVFGKCVRLVKLDVQGFENRVVLASEKILRENPPTYILLEYVAEGWHEAVSLLTRYEYVVARICKDGQFVPCDPERFQAGENALFYLKHEAPE